MLNVSSLIQKLTKREKYYFSKHNSASKNSSYFILYNYLREHPNADVQTLKSAFKDTALGNNLSVEINNLTKRILKTLHIFRLNNKSANYQILKNLSYISILIEKDEKKSALKLLKQTKKIAYYYEEFPLIIQIILLEEEHGFDSIDSELFVHMKNSRNERENIIAEINRLNTLRKLKSQIVEMQYKNGSFIDDISKFAEVFNHPLLIEDDYPFSAKGKDLFYVCKAILLSLKGKTSQSMKFNYLKIQNTSDNKHLFDDSLELKSIQNALFHLILSNNFDEYFKLYKRFNTFKNKDSIKPDLYAYFDCYLQLRLEIKRLNYKKLNELIILTEETLKKYDLNATQCNMLYHYLVGATIIVRDFKKGQDFIMGWNKVKKQKYLEHSKRLAKIIIYKETNNTKLLSHELFNFRKNFKPQNELSKYLVSYFSAFESNKNSSVISDEQLLLDLQRMNTKDHLKKYFIEFYFLSWAKSKNKKTPLHFE